jgi:2-oxoglutarate ferredoxin oxidoreductase subunit beta
MWYPEFPVPVGVLRAVDRPTHDELLVEQIKQARARSGEGDLAELINSGETWIVD